MSRIPLIIGNWKMYKTGAEARAFIRDLSLAVTQAERRIFLAVPFTAIEPASQAARGMRFAIGAQNMHDCEEGAFTGEVSARMLREAGAQFVILGHSERRQHFSETNAFINRKIHRTFAEGLSPVLCIGENLVEREENVTQRILSIQMEECLSGLNAQAISEMIIAYEPIWAIGTGKSATPSMAQDVLHAIRRFIEQSCGQKVAKEICLLYGGSVNADNIASLMKEPDIDGVLVGGASLDAALFANIINY
ncbi:MAG TPA: triose-phosphate isomerase [Rhabdochlamydiaceae bacterium]|jgi:triosephosphate isomerase